MVKKILKNLNFSFSNGELLGIFGPSGSGKTTLINLITGFKSNRRKNLCK